MAHSPQAKKRDRQNEARRIRNKSTATRMKSAVKAVLTAAESGDAAAATDLLPNAMKQVDKAAKAHVIHSNTAARRKSVMMRAIERAKA